MKTKTKTMTKQKKSVGRKSLVSKETLDKLIQYTSGIPQNDALRAQKTINKLLELQSNLTNKQAQDFFYHTFKKKFQQPIIQPPPSPPPPPPPLQQPNLGGPGTSAATVPAEWDIILNDPITHSSSHPGTKAFGEYVRARISHFKYYKMDNTSRRELENSIIKNLLEYFQSNGRFLIIEQGKKFRLANDDEVPLHVRKWFSLQDDNAPVFGSYLVEDFLEQHEYLNIKSIKFFDELYLGELREPWTPGEGLCGSADAAYNKNHQMNFHRPAYLRQNYSRTDTSKKTGNTNTVHRWTYGTGSGITTHGIPKCHLVFREFPDSLVSIAESVEMYLRQHLPYKSIQILPFTTAVIVTYMDGKIIQPHCDQRYTPDGEFLQSQNSQAQNTPTAILVIGDNRRLSFDLYCYKGAEQKFIMNWGEFELTHGSLFILDPSDEQPTIRHGLEQYGKTFFKHKCNGVSKEDKKMSIGIVFRSTIHLTEVQEDCGLVVLDKNNELKMIGNKGKKIEWKAKTKDEIVQETLMFEERNEILINYFAGKVHPKNKKSKANQRILDKEMFECLWKKCRDVNFGEM